MTSRQLTPPGLTQKLQGHRIGVAHHPLAIDDDHAARKQIQHVPQPLSEPLLLFELVATLRPRLGELVPELSDVCLQKPLGLVQLSGKLSETLERAFEVHRIGGLKGRYGRPGDEIH